MKNRIQILSKIKFQKIFENSEQVFSKRKAFRYRYHLRRKSSGFILHVSIMLMLMLTVIGMKMSTVQKDDLNITGNLERKEDVSKFAQIALQAVSQQVIDMENHPQAISHYSQVDLTNDAIEVWPEGLSDLKGSNFYNSTFDWWDQSQDWWETYGEPIELPDDVKAFYADQPTPRAIVEQQKLIKSVDSGNDENIYYYKITVLASFNQARSIKQSVIWRELNQ